MGKYDQIVVGGGISGLTATLLLARQGNRVLLIEKAPGLGGSIARFRRRGIPFDVGFHFTGGFSRNKYGMLGDMLRVLDLRQGIEPVFLPQDKCHEVAFSSVGETYALPQGLEPTRETLKSNFPSEGSGIDAYYERFLTVCEQTRSMNVRSMGIRPPALDEDFITLQEVLDQSIGDPVLKALMATYCTCHGTPPDRVPFSSHCRVTAGMQESTARVEGGGDAFVEAFRSALEPLEVDVRCGTTIDGLEDIRDGRVNRFCLSSGETVTADACLLTIHPQQILRLLPEGYTSPAFIERVEDFEPTVGFFSIFGRMNTTPQDSAGADPIFTVLPDVDFNGMMQPGWEGDRPAVVIFGREEVDGKPVKTMTGLEVCSQRDFSRWEDTRSGRRGAEYERYKQRRTARMRSRLEAFFPEFREDLEILDSASMLTFRDYLHNPRGAAYGIQQKVGQFNLIGKLPLINLYAAGQSSLLPGIVGAMASAFFVCRSIIGKSRLQAFIESRLCQ